MEYNWRSGEYLRRDASGGGRRSTDRGRDGRGTERRRWGQLAICLVLFLSVCVGKQMLPVQTETLRGQLLNMMTRDADVRGALTRLGRSISGEGTLTGDLGQFCVEVFGPQSVYEEQQTEAVPLEIRPDSSIAQSLEDQKTLNERVRETAGESAVPPETASEAVEQIIPAAGTLLLKADYQGRKLPENSTMDQLSLGGLETMTPVMGPVSSGFGYRTHPIDGDCRFHTGMDIAADRGEPIRAFADGQVEYIGKSDVCGLYTQIDHGNGVKSFYAHCSELYVRKGQQVEMGETIALVGDTGITTGPHLHLEIKYGDVRLNPAYYVDCEAGV